MPKTNQRYYRQERKCFKSFLNNFNKGSEAPSTSTDNIRSLESCESESVPAVGLSDIVTAAPINPVLSQSENILDEQSIASDSKSVKSELLDYFSDSNSSIMPCAPTQSLHESLADWAINHKISHIALNDLMKIINPLVDTTLPLDARTLLQTPRNYNIKQIGTKGQYHHFGLDNCLKNLLHSCEPSKYLSIGCLEVLINIDGLPISKSSASQFYPILCSLVINETVVDMIGIYHGYEKPQDPNSFLADFVNEAVYLIDNGFSFKEHIYSFRIKAFICDVPAKSFVLFTKGHSGYYSCHKCDVEGQYINGRVCFPEERFNLRTDYSFREKLQNDHHTGTSILEQLPNFNIIDNFVLDTMHLLYLGVVKKLIHLWVVGRPPSKLSSKDIENLSQSLLYLKSQITCEFNRKPRSVVEYKRWKATEFRQFLLYSGPVVLKKVLNNDMYLNFLSLHVAVTILSNVQLQSHFISQAHDCLKHFFKTFKTLYGKENASHNIHNLQHLAKESKNHGALDKFSAFHFENYMSAILQMIRKNDKPLQQVIRRKGEINSHLQNIHLTNKSYPQLSQEHTSDLTMDFNISGQYKKAVFSNFTLKINYPDNCCALQDKSIVFIKNFVVKDNMRYVIGQKFLKTSNFYMQPCCSSELGIYSLRMEYLSPLQSWSLNEIKLKYILLKLENEPYVAIPLVHIGFL